MRTDEQIQQDVSAELHWEPRLKGCEIAVEVYKATVTLTGRAHTYPQLSYAEKAARRVEDVERVINNMEVHPLIHGRDDNEIKEAVMNAINWNGAIDSSHIKVTVDHGWVTLEGEVPWDYQSTKARLLAEDTVGVIGVTNCLHVIPDSGRARA